MISNIFWITALVSIYTICEAIIKMGNSSSDTRARSTPSPRSSLSSNQQNSRQPPSYSTHDYSFNPRPEHITTDYQPSSTKTYQTKPNNVYGARHTNSRTNSSNSYGVGPGTANTGSSHKNIYEEPTKPSPIKPKSLPTESQKKLDDLNGLNLNLGLKKIEDEEKDLTKDAKILCTENRTVKEVQDHENQKKPDNLNDLNFDLEVKKNKDEKKDLTEDAEITCMETVSAQDNEKPMTTEQDEIQLIPSVLSTNDTGPWVVMDMTTPVKYVPIQPGTPRYERVIYKFMDTARNQDFTVEKVEQVQNPAAFGQFLLKKDEMQSRYGNVEVELLFHGSTEKNIKSICENNFNWRTCINSKFGRGISFSPISTYASHCCDKTYYKYMLFCLVLVSKECIGRTAMPLPDLYDEVNNLRCDTAVKNDENRSVVVKFSDHEFYPLYKFCYTGTPKPKNMTRNRYKTNYAPST